MELTKPNQPRVAKWPFLAGDALLLVVAWWIASRSPDPFAALPFLILVGCVGAGAWISILPFLTEYRGSLQLSEAQTLQSTAEKINQLEKIGDQVAGATAQWQDVQGQADKTVGAIAEISERMTAEAKAFGEFMQKANDTEKQHLRLEVDKLKRSEGDWLQIMVSMMDHVYALYRAAMASQKTSVLQQISIFRRACQDLLRRMGLVAFEIKPGDPYDANLHQLEKPEQAPAQDSGAKVASTLALGFTFQGKGLRKPLVSLQETNDPKAETGDLFTQPAPPAEPISAATEEAPPHKPAPVPETAPGEEPVSDPPEPDLPGTPPPPGLKQKGKPLRSP